MSARRHLMSPELVTQWLNTWRSDGVHVNSHELMYYRSKVNAFQRFRRLHPPPGASGALLSKFKGRGMEFDEFRHYQAGDDIRAIDWRVTARTGTPHTKLFREERERPVFVVVDFSDSMQFGSQLLFKSAQACHLAASLAWLAVARGDRIGAVMTSQYGHAEIKPQARHHGVMQVIHHLVEQQQLAVDSWQQQHRHQNVFPQALERMQQLARPGSIIYLISDWLSDDPALWRHCLALQRHCQLVPFTIIDPLELQLPNVSDHTPLSMTDGELSVVVDPVNKHQRHAYAHAQQQRLQSVVKQWQQLGCPLRMISSADALENQWPGELL
ncbi:DUF58 domain-containing protein [Pseudidiomarina marina]|uniref:DUF58 domain-containing protein n=1 Tax=Pseudidiomarina marina TaxID=502366 RepID=A0A432YKP7_9GAMM|nr:DUF58 domain-containing protein [Pseudidiomarina marina]PHR66414.1 MAG: DUF58 domain-containing protein [Idiomarina sp.]RUO61559.1 DUF58 domain-containing protein [Pseudidiomarina marina]